MTNIEWVKNPDGTQGITVNSKTGCVNHTPEGLCLGGLFPCYAFKLANGRLRRGYLDYQIFPVGVFDDEFYREKPLENPFYPRFWPERLDKIRMLKKPTGIFLDDMSDWMWEGWPEEWTRQEIQVMRDCPQHRFYTLTKQPQRLPDFSPFPDNAWVGVTATDTYMAVKGLRALEGIEAKVKYVSFEPLLSQTCITPSSLSGLDWLIIGACTGTWHDIFKLSLRYPELTIMRLNTRLYTLQPPIAWLQEIVEAADKAGVKVFLKDNLKPLFEIGKPYPWATDTLGFLRQEMPE